MITSSPKDKHRGNEGIINKGNVNDEINHASEENIRSIRQGMTSEYVGETIDLWSKIIEVENTPSYALAILRKL